MLLFFSVSLAVIYVLVRFYMRVRWGTDEELRAIADYALQRHFLDIKIDNIHNLVLLQDVIQRQATLLAD